MRNRPNIDTWRKFSNTLMQYLDRGALETLSDKNSVRPFLELCVQPSIVMQYGWSQDKQTSEITCNRAAKLKKKLDKLNAVQRSPEGDHLEDDTVPLEPLKTDTEVPRESIIPRVWHAFVSGLGGLVRLKRNERKARSGDVELALQSPSES
ncbi:hypothetical protein SISSUDRAFT_1067948 [Sistotremastrum suecicum HHB10207 ss-3]|uniref:Uncharacterized protein n=1 Tax=Sistotremastrum suecicum HHB10207 ss-3 TaxID=1314776 RepID=A0A165WJF8_9AGAM|nr:hypothetical protein SISSUDRAFT_1067948 [Sistotremastrum suecicum HHB10207 ss-3]